MNRKTTSNPEAITQLQRQLEQYRSTQSRRGRLPEFLRKAATELAREHGLHAVAHPLRLDYMRLKRRLHGVAEPQKKPAAMAFVELVSQPASKLEGWLWNSSTAGASSQPTIS